MTKPLLQILRNEKADRTPIWFMRQAGRYLPEYRNVRKNFSNFIEFCMTPDAAAEVTLQPLDRFDIDAAILFSDILIVPFAMGMKVEFEEKKGPVLGKINSPSDVEKYKNTNVQVFEKIAKTVSIVSSEMKKKHPNKTLIGFAGAPWTIAAYMIEGGGSKDFINAKKFAYQHEKEFSELIDAIVESTIIYLNMQIEAGAEVLKLFDSWSGVLTEQEFKKWVALPTKKIVSSLKQKYPNIPIIGFPRKAGVMYKHYVEQTKVDAVALDQYTPLSWANGNLKDVVLQGNIDNALLLTEPNIVKKEVEKFLEEVDFNRTIINLGHGMLPETKIENIEILIDTVRNYGSEKPRFRNKS